MDPTYVKTPRPSGLRVRRRDWRDCAKQAQSLAKQGSIIDAIRVIYYFTDKSCGLINAKHAAERLQALPEIRS